MKYDIADIRLAEKGMAKIAWAGKDMPVLAGIAADFKRKKPFKNITVGGCLHVTAETANLMIALKAGGAKVGLCASNTLSTQNDVAAALVKNFGIPVFAKKGESGAEYFRHLNAVLDMNPDITMDDGADLAGELHSKRKNQAKKILGGTEETTTGVIRLKALQKASSGFDLAELDLKMRGPGELSGRKQWGISDLGMEAIKNIKIVEAARLEATALLARDPELKNHPLLAERVSEKVAHWE